jgi:hypothetical protein
MVNTVSLLAILFVSVLILRRCGAYHRPFRRTLKLLRLRMGKTGSFETDYVGECPQQWWKEQLP